MTVRVALVEDGLTWLSGDYVADPARMGVSRLARCCLARTLMAYPGLPTLEGGTIPYPDLAAGPPVVSADGLLWSFAIRPGVRYQPPFDDRTVVAADVVRGIERSIRLSPDLVDPGMPFERLDGAAAYAEGAVPVIGGLQSADEMSLTFRLTSPDGAFGHYLTDATTAPIPEGASEPYDPVPRTGPSVGSEPPPADAPFAARFVSSGPYMYETYPAQTAGGRVTLVRNPSWDQATDLIRTPLPDRIEILTVADPEQALAMVERGDVDILDHLPDAEVVARYKRDPALAGRLREAATEMLTFVPMNLAVPPFDDVAVRRAVNAAVDRAGLRDAILDGRAGLPWMRGFRGTGEVARHVFADHLTAGLLVTYDPFPSAGGSGDVAAARAEMRRSRYDTDGDGLCDAPSCAGAVLVAEFPRAGEVLREGLAGIGIEVDMRAPSDDVSMDFPANRTAVQVNWWQWAYGLHGDLDDLLRGGAMLATEPPVINMSLVGATPTQLGSWGYDVTAVPAVDELLDHCERESGHRRARCWAQLDQLVSEVIVPWIPVYTGTASWVFSPRVVSTALDQSAAWIFPALERTVVTDDIDP